MTASVRFEEAGPRVVAPPTEGTVLQALREAAQTAGIDPVAELYNEALELAQEGHYGQAQHRLGVLLGLAPGDGEAHLLLAKVLVAGQQWRRALAALDEATQCGTSVPRELRDAVLRNLQSDEDGEEQRKARATREQSEVNRLRSETRRLRSENASLQLRAFEAEKETRRWAWVATGTSLVAILFILSRMVFGGGDASAPAPVEAAPVAGAPTAAEPSAVDPASPRNGDLGAQAVAAVMAAGGMEGAQLEVTVRGANAQLTGYVANFAQIKKAQKVVEGMGGIDNVGADGVIILAKRDGATHTVKPGESLGQIAYNYYGRSSWHAKIQAANPALANPAALKAGMQIVIPPVRDE